LSSGYAVILPVGEISRKVTEPAVVRSAARDGEHVSFVQGQLGCAVGGWGELFAGPGGARVLQRSADLVDGAAVGDDKDVVAALVLLELRGGLGDLGGHHHGAGKSH
jgi:hypothetical protein